MASSSQDSSKLTGAGAAGSTDENMNLEEQVVHLKAKIADLENNLEKEQQRRQAAEEVVIKVKKDSAHTQVIVEQEEEYISNMLMKRLAELKNEKETLAKRIEEEEEYLTNNLQMKLNEVKREKIQLENQLEQEQEFIVNKLQRKLNDLESKNTQLERQVQVLSANNSPATSLRSLDQIPSFPGLQGQNADHSRQNSRDRSSRNPPSNSSSFSYHSGLEDGRRSR